ncbi:hypothetical protein FOZ61_008450 [Perkinsus olseni]|uniref:Uncharacterized protein n=1 Tax=Perkinsus olseni TaxID=32597 RepID=A0A7J6M716_PEROL|nr:hypothetical protein FOZ61_008450 [Perkinsus olseni]
MLNMIIGRIDETMFATTQDRQFISVIRTMGISWIVKVGRIGPASAEGWNAGLRSDLVDSYKQCAEKAAASRKDH